MTHSPGRPLGIADYLFRHPSPSNKTNQIKTEELWNDWFVVNETDDEKVVLDKHKKTGNNQSVIQQRISKWERKGKKERTTGKRKSTNQRGDSKWE